MKEKKISIIVPMHNSEKTIEKCITSVLAQEYGNYELMLIDDGSTDATVRICKKTLKSNFDKVKLITLENRGVSNARNLGLSKANGEYCIFVDSEQFDKHNKKILQLPEKKYASTREFIDDFYPLIGNQQIHTPWAKVYKLEVIKRFNIQFPVKMNMGEDFCFNLEYLKNISKIEITNFVSYAYSSEINELSNNLEIDAFQTRKHMIFKLREILTFFDYDIEVVNFQFVKLAYSYLMMLTTHKVFDHQLVKKMIEDTDLGYALKNTKPKNILEKILIKILKTKNINLLLMCACMMGKLQKRRRMSIHG